jgi:hypothetical protein
MQGDEADVVAIPLDNGAAAARQTDGELARCALDLFPLEPGVSVDGV